MRSKRPNSSRLAGELLNLFLQFQQISKQLCSPKYEDVPKALTDMKFQNKKIRKTRKLFATYNKLVVLYIAILRLIFP